MKKLLIIASIILFPSLVFAQTFDSNLYFGLTNNSDVQMLQEFLTDQGVYSGPITGNFFSLTLAAVKKYQTQNNITPAAGFFGPMTRSKANEVLSTQLNASDQQATVETGTVAPVTTPSSTTDSSQQLMQSLQSQILALMQQITQMQQQNQTIQSQQTQIQNQQTQLQQNQQNQIGSMQQQITPSTPTPTPTPTPAEPVAPTPKPAIKLELRNDILTNSLRSNYVEILVEQNPQNTGNQTGKKWEIFINDQPINIIPFTNANSGWASFHLPNLTPETTYTYKVVYKEDGREDSIKTGTFKTISLKETVSCKFIFSHNYGQVNAGGMFIHLDVNSHGDGNQLLNLTFSCNPGDFASIKLISMDMKYGLEWDDYNFNRMSKFAPMELNFSNGQFNDNYQLNFSSDGLVIRAPQTVNISGSKTINLHNSSPVNFNVTIKDTVVQSSSSNDPVTFSFSNLKFSDDAGNQYTIYTP